MCQPTRPQQTRPTFQLRIRVQLAFYHRFGRIVPKCARFGLFLGRTPDGRLQLARLQAVKEYFTLE